VFDGPFNGHYARTKRVSWIRFPRVRPRTQGPFTSLWRCRSDGCAPPGDELLRWV